MSFATFRRRGVAIAATGALATLAGIGGAMAATSKRSPSSSSSTTASSPAEHPMPGPGKDDPGWPGPAGGFRDHGRPISSTATVLNQAGNGYITVTENNGKVKSLAGDQLTIARGTTTAPYPDVTLTIPSNATIMRDDSPAQLSALQPGDTVGVTQSSQGTSVMDQSPSFNAQQDPDHGPWGPGGPQDANRHRGPAAHQTRTLHARSQAGDRPHP